VSAALSAISRSNPRYRSRKRVNAVYRRRRSVNKVMMALSAVALAFGLFWLAWILGVLIWEGANALRHSLF
jgi:phosphate transport system permease protein